MVRQTVFDYSKKEYDTLPEYLWHRYDTSAVFRHSDNKKVVRAGDGSGAKQG